MPLNQNETAAQGSGRVAAQSRAYRPSALRHAFTLTELLVVIGIIAVLAGLITAAALNAWNKAKQTAITFELQQISGAVEEFNNRHGIYPPNIYSAGVISSIEQNQNASNLLLTMKRISPRSTEFNSSANASSGQNNITSVLQAGLTPAEALVFWLSGFSGDETRPLSGADLEVVAIDDNGTPVNNVVTFDSFPAPLYEFEVSRLRFSRDSNGARRFITVHRQNDVEIYIQLYEYLPSGSDEPYVYFDTSRENPSQVVNNWSTSEFFYSSRNSTGGAIYPIKQIRADAPNSADWVSPRIQYLEYVNKERFQILHCGIDNLWGDFSTVAELNLNDTEYVPALLFPDGPFIGEVADTVGNFITGTLEDEQE